MFYAFLLIIVSLYENTFCKSAFFWFKYSSNVDMTKSNEKKYENIKN